MVLRREMTVLLWTGLAGIVVAGGFKSLEEIPDACTPSPLVPDGGRCLFGYQCATGFCCPFLKSCTGNSGLSSDAVEKDALRKKIMWSAAYGGEADCGADTCDVCAMRGCTDCDMCQEVDTGDGAKPILLGDPMIETFKLAPYDIGDPKCKCHSEFVSAWKAGTWVEGCAPTPASAAGSAPAAAVANTANSNRAGWAFSTLTLLALANAVQVN